MLDVCSDLDFLRDVARCNSLQPTALNHNYLLRTKGHTHKVGPIMHGAAPKLLIC